MEVTAQLLAPLGIVCGDPLSFLLADLLCSFAQQKSAPRCMGREEFGYGHRQTVAQIPRIGAAQHSTLRRAGENGFGIEAEHTVGMAGDYRLECRMPLGNGGVSFQRMLLEELRLREDLIATPALKGGGTGGIISLKTVAAAAIELRQIGTGGQEREIVLAESDIG